MRHKVHPNQVGAWKQRVVKGDRKPSRRGRSGHVGPRGREPGPYAQVGELTVERIDDLFLKYPFQSELVRQSREGEGIGRACAH